MSADLDSVELLMRAAARNPMNPMTLCDVIEVPRGNADLPRELAYCDAAAFRHVDTAAGA